MASISITQPGDFVVGCNYWASHAGTRMWANWRPEVVAVDLQRLAANGIQVMRVFPLWPDFQPIVQLRGGAGALREIRMAGDIPLPDTPAGRAGVSEVMLERFAHFADLCQQHNIQLIVGLLTGWMSGRLFVPPALEHRNVLTDPVCLMWEMRFVDCFVRRFKDHPAIYAWDLGNECNCMAPVENHAAAYAWSAAIANAIRAADPSRPVVSGMHSLTPGGSNPWLIQDQAETTDILTTHPYPYWTPYVRSDPLNTIRPLLHATAETRMYADIGGKPCMAEEIGTMGPMISSEEAAAAFTRTNLFSLWAHDCRSFIWWCNSDQTELTHPPYDWTAVERELGLLRTDGTAKPMLDEIRCFRAWRENLPIPSLPVRGIDAMCILTRGQDHWAAGYSAYVLAKQARLNLAYQYVEQPLRDAPCYLLPSLSGGEAVPDRRWRELLAKVSSGATLYISLNDAILDRFNAVAGVRLITRAGRRGPAQVTLADGAVITLASGDDLRLAVDGAEVLGQEADGNPVFTRSPYGKGWVYVLTFPLETQLTHTPGAFHAADAQPYHRVYAAFAAGLLASRALRLEAPMLGLTEHALSANERVAVVINYAPEPAACPFTLTQGWKIDAAWNGTAPKADIIEVPPNDAVVLKLSLE
jgi:hypothetical protein